MRRGFTLLEVVISSGLLLLILGLLLAMFLSAVRALREGERRSSVQRSALILLQRLRQELNCAHRDSLLLDPQQGLVFLSDRNAAGQLRYTPGGQRLWLRWQTVGWLATRQVVLRQWSITNPTSPPVLTPPVANAAGWSQRMLAADVEQLNFQVDAQGALHLQLRTAREGLQYEVNTVLALPLDGG